MKQLSLLLLFIFSISLGFSQSIKTKKVKTHSKKKLRKEVYYVQAYLPSIKEGPYVEYYKKVKITEGQYSNNKKTGKWNYYDYSDKLNFSGSFIDGEMDGKWTYYYNSSLASELYFTKGVVDSVFGYYESGILAYDEKYFADSTGLSRTYFNDGSIQLIVPIKNRHKDGVYQLFFENGQVHKETMYKEGKKYSVISSYDINGNEIFGGSLKDGNGTYIAYFTPTMEDDSLIIQYDRNYKNGQLDGSGMFLREDGSILSKGSYIDGKRAGIWKHFKRDGTISKETNYDDIVRTKRPRYLNYIGEILNTKDTAIIDKFWVNSEFQGGYKEYLSFRNNNYVYPRALRGKGYYGSIVASFTISITGEIGHIEIDKGFVKEFEQEVIKILEMMPRANPELDHGVPQGIIMRKGFRFTLK
ncbi:MAG: hypothetical protein GQ527_13370 [Bacteroidales bacterium]|nr:hypothetical protein [Bacteroidales bacterium]